MTFNPDIPMLSQTDQSKHFDTYAVNTNGSVLIRITIKPFQFRHWLQTMASTSPVVPLLVVLLGTFLYYTGINYLEPANEINITTKFGDLKGFTSKTRDGREYSSFKGIPYAQPPVGKLRFQPPLEIGKWEGIRDATRNPPFCTQADLVFNRLDGQEDCLYLNVYTPKTAFNKGDQETLYPVLFFIHGGYFMFGSQDLYGPQYLLDSDVVVVTINYRLGALGFLNTGSEARGNMGLKDQVMALKFVKSAIRDFGGDPDVVTIFGESAGAASVNYHMISPLSERLFHRAISQSGASICPWTISRNTISSAKTLGQKLNCPIGTTEALMKCLMEVDAGKIAGTHIETTDPFHGQNAIFGPSVEYDTGDEEDMFLYEDPLDSARDGQFARVPWLVGLNAEEGCFKTARFIHNDTKLTELFQNWKKLAPQTLIYEKDDIVSNQILQFYFGNNKNNFTSDDYLKLTNMYSDRFFFGCTDKAAQYHAVNSPAYMYYLEYKSDLSFGNAAACPKDRFPTTVEILLAYLKQMLYTKVLGWEVHDFGVCHADDLQYLFSTISLWEIPPKSKHYEFSKSMVKLWTSFAKYGRPMNFGGVEWERVTPGADIKYMRLSSNPKMISAPFRERINFWNSLHV